MAFTDIYYIYGIQLNVTMMIKLFGKDIAEALIAEYVNYKGNEHWLDAETQENTEGESREPSKLIQQLRELTIIKNEDCLYDAFAGFLKYAYDIFEYPCCSEEMEKTWILGVQIPKLGMQSMFHKSMGLRNIVNLNFPEGDQVKTDWQKLVSGYGLQEHSGVKSNGESSTEKTLIVEPDVYLIFNDCLSCT